MSKYPTIQQHEPLRVPENWGQQEKRFVAQLEEVLDDIYRRFGRLREEDLGANLRKTIVSSAESASEAVQTANSFTIKFQSIGTIAPQTGITKVDEKGITVNHSTIGGHTQMSADGFKIVNAAGQTVGGMYSKNGSVVSAVQSLYNPNSSSFIANVGAQTSFNGSVTGLQMVLNNSSTGVVGAYSDSRGNKGLGMYTNGRVELQSGLSDSGSSSSIDMRNGTMYFSADTIELSAPTIRFVFEDESGRTFTKTISDIYNMIIDLM